MLQDIANLFHGFAVVAQPFNLALMVLGAISIARSSVGQ